MHFCPKCENMFQIRLEDNNPNKLIYYCPCCQLTDTYIDENKSLVVSYASTQTAKYHHIINEYTKFDPTLPRIAEKMLCPNLDCQTNAEKNRASQEIIKICYDESNKKYVYLCAICDEIWELA